MSCMAHRQVFRSFCHVSLRAKVVADQFCSECPAELSRVLTDVDLLDHTPWVLVNFVSEDREDSLNCLNSLNTPEARDRIAGVSPRFGQTYEWILDPGSWFILLSLAAQPSRPQDVLDPGQTWLREVNCHETSPARSENRSWLGFSSMIGVP